MKILGNKIVYPTHTVECDVVVADAEYMVEMAGCLSTNGSAKQHIIELDNMNNDGSWTVY